MICGDIEKIYRERNIPNKYVLTLIFAERARQLSERKGSGLGYDEKFITRAMEDVAEGKVHYTMTQVGAEAKTEEAAVAETEEESVEAE